MKKGIFFFGSSLMGLSFLITQVAYGQTATPSPTASTTTTPTSAQNMTPTTTSTPSPTSQQSVLQAATTPAPTTSVPSGAPKTGLY